MPLPLLQVDAFTERPFRGNPAGVVFLDEPRDDDWLRAVAAELKHSETAYLIERADGDYDLRWFTPAAEVDLCGHATLASAHAIWETSRRPTSSPIRFHTRSGALTARHEGRYGIRIDLPAHAPERAEPPPGLFAGLGVRSSTWVGRSAFDFLVLVSGVAVVQSLQPDFRQLASVDARGICVTAASTDPEVHFVSRFFAPRVGVDEDPVTGSAHAMLGPFWAGRLKRRQLVAQQLSARGGTLRLDVSDDRVALTGKAVTVSRGELLV